jgi:phospholipase C
MALHRSTQVLVINRTGGNATIHFFHTHPTHGTQRGTWRAGPEERVGPLTVHFPSGEGVEAGGDRWSVLVHVHDGPEPGFYVSSGNDDDEFWHPSHLQAADADAALTFSVRTGGFSMALDSGEREFAMRRVTPHPTISHVFVVMLENHSFDHLLAMSGIPGIVAATTADSNTFNGNPYPVQSTAPLSMPTDPAHEFPDVVEQLAGAGATYPRGGPYPPIDLSGFVANYAGSKGRPTPAEYGDVMACFATPTQLPALYQMATQFAVCDHWFSSLPGPTWPNRFFVHGASSAGLDDSPSLARIARWEIRGFRYPHGSIYDALRRAGIRYRFYNDTTGIPLEQSLYSDHRWKALPIGAVPQVSSLHNVSLLRDFHSLKHFAPELQGPYPYSYTFIEPHYGNLLNDSYAGGSSQHPKDDVYGGEHLLAAVYSAIRNSPYWESSLLIVTYDEHGGLYDCVAPGAAPAPADGAGNRYNRHGFDFTRYGVRVPGVVVSPLIPAGKVSDCVYDHASVLKTVEELFGLDPLTQRDAHAASLVPLLELETPRTDCPLSLDVPISTPRALAEALTAEEQAMNDALPLPEEGNLAGALLNLKKAEIEMTGGEVVEAESLDAWLQTIQTRGQARAYAESVMARVGLIRERREAEERGQF